jgi:hypothetical protein
MIVIHAMSLRIASTLADHIPEVVLRPDLRTRFGFGSDAHALNAHEVRAGRPIGPRFTRPER